MEKLNLSTTTVAIRIANRGKKLAAQPEGQNDRISGIDGWRAIAVLGVLYTHTWAILQFPSFYIGGINLMQLINLLGSGVHLFFVISGFCFFAVMSRMKSFHFKNSLQFLKRRWFRIAPAFYISCSAYLVYNGWLNNFSDFGWQTVGKLAANFCFLQNHIAGTEISAPFWSLAVEWHFYTLLPLMFFSIVKKGFANTLFLIGLLGLILNALHYSGFLMAGTGWWYTIFANINHFIWGIVVGFVYQKKTTGLKFFQTRWGFFASLLIAYAGKLMFSSAFVRHVGQLDFISQTIGPVLMTFGFGLLVYNTLTNKKIFRVMSNKVLVLIGRVSYSFYLWHTLFLYGIFKTFKSLIPQSPVGVFLLFLLVTLFLLPFSCVSYRLLEQPYFKNRKREEARDHNHTPHPVQRSFI